MFIRKSVLDEIGLLDEDFFMYGEDIDWAYQIKANGWKIYYNPVVTVTHVKRAASRKSPKAQIEFYRAMDIFYHKFYAATTPFWLHALIIFGIRFQQGLTVLKHRWQELIQKSTGKHSAEVPS